jgi:hypothetical protein
MAKHGTSMQPVASTQEQWLLQPVEQLTCSNDGDTSYQLETEEGSALLTDLQRAALRWLSSFD